MYSSISHPTDIVSIHAYSGVARFITAYVTRGYIFGPYDKLINQPTTSSISSSHVDNSSISHPTDMVLSRDLDIYIILPYVQ
jgi:hypothetical protein